MNVPDSDTTGGPLTRALLSAGLAVALLTGCAGGLREGQEKLRAGDATGAVAALQPAAEKNTDGADAVILWLELGSALHHAGEFEASSDALLVAEDRVGAIDDMAQTRLGNETRGLLTNPGERTYEGYGYDRVMAPTYRALNAMLAGDLESPRQALIEASFQTEDAIAKRAERLEKAEEDRREAEREADNQTKGRDTERDPGFNAALNERYGDLDRYEPYAEYANPFTEWLQAAYLLGTQQDAADADRARSLLRRVAGMSPKNTFVRSDLDSADAAASGTRIEPTTFVIFSTGFAPVRDGFRVDLPLFLVNDEVDYVGAVFPYLEFTESYDRFATITAGPQQATTELLADMDRIIAADFNAERPILITRTVASAIAKAGVAFGLNKASEGDDIANAITRLITTGYQVWQNKTDERTWSTLPKQFQYAHVPTPASGVVTVRTTSGLLAEFAVDPGSVNLLYVRSMGPGLPLLTGQATLRSGISEAVASGENNGDES
ncbi:MAG: hypothetical protein AAGG07_05590 [Planctomycetota bacterium]